MGSLGDQQPSDGFGTCSLHRFTRALKCVLREETRPKEKVVATPRRSWVQLPSGPAPPPRCLWSESLASARALTLRPIPLVRGFRPGELGPSRLPANGTGSASMPTLWSVGHREPFECASLNRVVSPLAGLLTDLIRVFGWKTSNGPSAMP